MKYVTEADLKKSQSMILTAVAKLVAKEIKRIDEKFLNSASPVEQYASNVADSIIDDLIEFNDTTPVFSEGDGTPNALVKMTWNP